MTTYVLKPTGTPGVYKKEGYSKPVQGSSKKLTKQILKDLKKLTFKAAIKYAQINKLGYIQNLNKLTRK
ncbi:hypothetical protein DID75_03980 [Candidatus Marinamargulisbacteria bacterium SCGC AG-410-N11]|nr:hypothetical protein DID75_03980 [Candidatus Marinamargulisbacteria bacterium SCGC AG-410-N11]